MTNAINDSKNESYLLVQFEIQGTYYRFTNWGTTIDPGGANWVSTPELEVKWPKNSGTLEANGCIINTVFEANATMDTLIELLLGSGAPVADINVEIREVIKPVEIGDEATELIPFKGQVIQAVRNAQGRAKRVRFEVQSIKARLQKPLGLPCNHHCPWTLFGRGCSVQGGASARGPQLISERRLRNVSSIDGVTITVDSDPSLTAPKSFRFGYVERNGVRIPVFDWDSSTPTEIILRQRPPDEWQGEQVILVPGCSKTIEACRDEWNNEDNFGGIGHAIPAYNPTFEEGQ